jgi:hypothetical protein
MKEFLKRIFKRGYRLVRESSYDMRSYDDIRFYMTSRDRAWSLWAYDKTFIGLVWESEISDPGSSTKK